MTTEKTGVVVRGETAKSEQAPPKQLDMAGFQAFAAAVARMENAATDRLREASAAPRQVKVSSLESLKTTPDNADSPADEPVEAGAVIARFPSGGKVPSDGSQE